MEYYSAIEKKEILPFATTWMELEGIMVSEIRQRKINTIGSHLYVESEKNTNSELTDTEKRLVVATDRWGWGGENE